MCVLIEFDKNGAIFRLELCVYIETSVHELEVGSIMTLNGFSMVYLFADYLN